MAKSICIRYTLVSIGTMLALGIISYILQTYFNFDTGSSAGIVSVFVPALDAGMTYYNKSGEAPSKAIRWIYARYFTLIQIMLSTVILTILWSILPELSTMSTSVGLTIMGIVAAVYLIVIFLTNRYFFGMGITTAEKAAIAKSIK